MFSRFLIIALFSVFIFPVKAEVVARLKENAQVSSRQVSLAEVVSFDEDAESAIVQALGETLVATVMHVNRPIRIESAQIMRLVSRQQPALRNQLRLTGASAVTVILAGEKVPTERIAEAAKAFLHDELHRKRIKFAIRNLHIGSNSILVPDGDLQLKARLAAPLQAARRINVVVDLIVGNRRFDSITVSAAIDMIVPAFRATRQLAAGDVVQEGDYELVERPFDESMRSLDLLDTKTEPASLRVRRNIAAKAIFYRHDVEPVPHVVRNQKVLVEVKSNGILIEKTVIAQSDGFLGQLIKVSDPQSTEFYPAKIVAHGRVEVK
ncbi:flagella basal body P-ring formation protein FlgA [Paucimonas lemoignei]|uniref:Flagella basal body P-ring formation protein FlgA n=1 Tax=Paucimonas lemoignei TaxID=29443 RepID=A0A4R3HZL8_PAULE|nr:flagellar basal body P-ring formation chaperone FlgA [Paucimonas lemoignei]TCS37715.1 flagella basal body P-ring formation protein FlgA [Paucimonas lemoignei]